MKKIEKESNQILDFTREIKKMNETEKIKIIEILWRLLFQIKDPKALIVVSLCKPRRANVPLKNSMNIDDKTKIQRMNAMYV